MAYYLRMHNYTVDDVGVIRCKRPKFPKGKANIKAEKRRTHEKYHYLVERLCKSSGRCKN